MPDTTVTALIAGGSAIVGGVIVSSANLVISRRQAAEARRTGLRQTLTALLSALGQVDHELRLVPKSKKTVRVINDQVAKRFPQVDYITRLIHLRLFQPHLNGLIVRLHDALVATLLVAPPSFLPLLQLANDALVHIDINDKHWWKAWDDARAALVVASRELLGEHERAARTGAGEDEPAPARMAGP